MIHPLIAQIIPYIGYGFGLVSFIFLVLFLGYSPKKVRQRLRITKEIKTRLYMADWMKYKPLRLYHHLLSAVSTKYQQQHFVNILMIQVACFLLIGLFLHVNDQSIMFSASMSLIFTFGVPITIAMIKYKKIQMRAQMDLLEGVTKLLQQYRKNDQNMLYALKDAANELSGDLQMIYRKLFARLHGNKEEQQLASESFAFAIGHSWGANLGVNILKSVQDGINVEIVLNNMIKDITEHRKRVRDIETDGIEVIIFGLTTLPAAILMVFVTAEYLLPVENGYKYIFQTSLGLKIFMLSILGGFVNFIMAYLLSNPKQGL